MNWKHSEDTNFLVALNDQVPIIIQVLFSFFESDLFSVSNFEILTQNLQTIFYLPVVLLPVDYRFI